MTDIINNISGVELDNQNAWHDTILNATPQQVENYIQNNVTDLDSAKAVLTKLAKIIVILVKREKNNA